MTDESFTRSAEMLTRLAASQASIDAYLLDIAELGEERFPVSIGLLLNGMVVVGNVTSGAEMAEAVDELRQRLVSRTTYDEDTSSFSSREEWDRAMKDFASRNAQFYRDRAAQIEEVDQEISARIDAGAEEEELPGDLREVAIWNEARPFMTLRDVQIGAPGETGLMRIPVLRVRLAQVQAWWPVPIDDEGRARITLFAQPGN